MMARPVIVAIGEVLWDVYPDAVHFGGAPANVACHAASLGAEAWMVSAVGVDAPGARAVEALRTRGVETLHLAHDPHHATGRVLVTLDQAGVPSYDIVADSAWDHRVWSDDLGRLAARADAVCFGTLGQRSPVSRATIRRFVTATPPGALRLLDVNLRQGFDDADTIRESLRIATAMKLNDDELPIVARVCGIRATTSRDMLIELAAAFQLRLAALTRGPGGAVLIAGGDESDCPALATNVVDTVGAGDAFAAALVTGVLQELPLDATNRRANAIAAFVCSEPGATPRLPAELCAIPDTG